MDSQNSKINVLVVGAFGNLGAAVTRQCLAQPNLAVSILVRDPQKNKELTDRVTQAGGKVIKADLSQPETLKGVTKGMHTLIMTFDSRDDKVIVDGQIALIKDGIENNVQRVVPAEFGTNHLGLTTQEIEKSPVMHTKLKVQDYLKTAPIKHLYINTGILLDWFLDHVLRPGFTYWGDSSLKLQYTSYEDTGKAVAAAVAQKDREGDLVYVSNEATTVELAEAYNRARGTDLKAKHLGTLQELHAKVAELQKEGKNMEAFWLELMGFVVYDERARFSKTDNAELKDVKKESLEEFFRLRPDILIGA